MVDTQPRRKLRAIAAVVGILLAAGVAEIVLRMTHWGVYALRQNAYHFLARDGEAYWFGDPSNPPEHIWDRDPFGRLPPGARMTYPLNSRGLRGPEPDPGRAKVLLVGDSFTFGEGVVYEETFVARLGTALDRRLTPAPQVLCGGVPGYGTDQEAARLPAWLAEFRPRAVVVVFVPNDPIPLEDVVGHDDFLAASAPAPSFYLGRLVSGALGRTQSNHAVEDWYASYYFGEKRARWEATQRQLADMKAKANSAGARFGVVLFPLLYRLDEKPFAKMHDAVAGACRGMSIPVLDLTDALAVEPDRALWVHPTDHHPDSRAHELAAAAMTPFVEGLLR